MPESIAGKCAARDRSVRAEYVREVASLSDKAGIMLGFGLPEEVTARVLHAERRALSERYKQLTTASLRTEPHRRNSQKYGDPQAPSIDYLRARGDSWSDIISSASRPNAT